jgi:hypothetical protein
MPSDFAPRHTATTGIHPALQSFADECQALLGRLLLYMGGLGFIAIVLVILFRGVDLDVVAGTAITAETPARPGWAMAERSQPAFAVSQFETSGKTATYKILRHLAGGRKDILSWAAPGETPVAELELYRFGDEADRTAPAVAEVAGRMDPASARSGSRETVGEGIVDSKFGPVALFSFADQLRDGSHCLGFVKALDAANIRMSGWSCQGDSIPARRAAIACTLNRLVLLNAANDPKTQDVFARAELKRAPCAATATLPSGSANWVTGAQNPLLRGSL